MCERLGLTFTQWANLPASERLMWFGYFRINPDGELYGRYSEDLEGMTFAEFRQLRTDQKEALAEYDQHREDMQRLGCSRREFISYDPAWRTAKVDFARKIKGQFSGDDQ